MSWYQMIDQEQFWRRYSSLNDLERKPFIMSVIDSAPHAQSMSAIGQLFVAPFVLMSENTSNMASNVPFRDMQVMEMLDREVIPHFDTVRKCSQEGALDVLLVKELRATSSRMFHAMRERGELNPYVAALYLREQPFVLLEAPPSTYMCRLVLDREPEEAHEDFRPLWDALTKTYGTETPHITWIPTGWVMDEGLRYNRFIRGLRAFCEEIYLEVEQASGSVRSVTWVIPS